MPKELDSRDFRRNKLTGDRINRLKDTAENISREKLEGDHKLRIDAFDPTTANSAVIASEGAPPEKGRYIERALKHLQTISPAMGFSPTQAADFKVDPVEQRTSSGAVAVYARQMYKNILVFQSSVIVRFAPNGAITDTAGHNITIDEDLSITPKLSAKEAVLKAVQFLTQNNFEEREVLNDEDEFVLPKNIEKIDLSGFNPKIVITNSDDPAMSTFFDGKPFEENIQANLVWFPKNEVNVHLSWEVFTTMPKYSGQYLTIIDAENGEILFNRQIMDSVKARGMVYEMYGNTNPTLVDFPRQQELGEADTLEKIFNLNGLSKYSNLPQTFPLEWVKSDSTEGNNAFVHWLDNGPPSKGILQDTVMTFNSTNAKDVLVTNLFYHNCLMHDFFYIIGFTESDGNFEGNDPVDARVLDVQFDGVATMSAAAPDRSRPIMRMGLYNSTNRHSALDAGVIAHEYMHGVTNRLVGGPFDHNSLISPQSRGLGEGWSDYLACTIYGKTVLGDWLLNRPNGFRKYAYDDNFPDNFSHLGKGRYNYDSNGRVPVHNIGEIWCATLCYMNRKIEEKLGGPPRIGAVLGLQLVVDALKLSESNPSFLNMRDCILRALDDKEAADQLNQDQYKKIKLAIWESFAKFGMGSGAQSNGAQLDGIVANFNVPAL